MKNRPLSFIILILAGVLSFVSAISVTSVTAFAQDSHQAAEAHRIGIVAHRGYWNCEEAGYAQNSVASLRAAQEYGFWGCEFDLNMTSDEVILVYHDTKIDGRRIDSNLYSEFAADTLENGEEIPTLDDYLAQAAMNPKTVLICEFKKHSTPEKEDRIMELTFAKLREYGLYDPANVIFVSFSRHICDKIVRDMPEFAVMYPDKDLSPEDLAESGINFIYYQFRNITDGSGRYEKARGLGMGVDCWTVDERDDMEAVVRLGVDYITTNEPVALRGLLKEMDVDEL